MKTITTAITIALVAWSVTAPKLLGQESVTDQATPIAQYGHASQWMSDTPEFDDVNVSRLWQCETGVGQGQVIGDQATVYVASGSSKRESQKTELSAKVVAIDTVSGETKWTFTFDTESMPDQQETHGGAMATPQSTPLIVDDKLYSINFSGQLVCLNRFNGDKIWTRHLVKEFGAIPVQYGFSSSPIVDPNQPNELLVMAAGKEGGLLNLDARSGKLNWKCLVETFSYATPVSANFGGEPQWIVISEDEIIGIEKRNGERLWSHPLAKPGLTNVPSPLVLDDSELVVSGQGCGGTRKLAISKTNKQWSVKEVWFQARVQFFYTNWMAINEHTILGCVDQFLVAIDSETGNIIGKWRGFNDGNLIRIPRQFLSLNGRGILNTLSLTNDGKALRTDKQFQLAEGRCWTPPTLIKDQLYVRCENALHCYRIATKPNPKDLANLASKAKTLAFDRPANGRRPDPVEEIFTTFQNQGAEAALKLYAKYRSDGQLSANQRIGLAEAASDQGLADLGKMILDHASEDLPQSQEIKDAIKSWGRKGQ